MNTHNPADVEAVWSDVDRYFETIMLDNDPVLSDVLTACAKENLPFHSVSPTQGKFLNLIATLSGARKILELGTLGGYSTIWLARALPQDGKLVSIEYVEKHALLAAENVARAGLTNKVKIMQGKGVEVLPQLIDTEQGPFDLIFIDADKQNNPEYLRLSLQLSRPGTIIIADNVVRNGEVIDPDSSDPKVVGMRGYFELARQMKLQSTALQTVGSKGYDGFAISIVP